MIAQPAPKEFNRADARRHLLRIGAAAPQALAAFLPQLLAALEKAANPDRVLVNFERLIERTE